MLSEHKRYMKLLIDGGVSEDASMILAILREERQDKRNHSYCPKCCGFLLPSSQKEIDLGASYRCKGRGCA
jgi:hypothetical protein